RPRPQPSPVMRLDGKVCLITGGAHGHGEAASLLFTDEGASVVVADVDDIAGVAVASSAGARFEHLDVTSPDNWQRVVDSVVSGFGRIDVLYNSAGIVAWHTMTETPLEVWQRVIAVNQTGPFLGMRAVAPVMKRQRSGSIINTSSVGGLGGSSPCYAYGATKWALRGMTRGAAQELGPFNVRVNAILPGTIRSRMIDGMDLEAMAASIPLRRVGLPAEVAELALWLASDDSTYASGADFLLDGGSRS
ncbi:MAG: SDR family oxidoreductase, partial [Acidimicrobiales bacterium]